jgi:predicted DNA-binding transcriptional regulator AlpA
MTMTIMAKSETRKRATVPAAVPLPARRHAQVRDAINARPPPMIDGVLLDNMPPDGLLTADQVIEVIPVTKRQWLDGVRAKRFPKSVRFSIKLMFWRVDDIRAYIQSLNDDGGA